MFQEEMHQGKTGQEWSENGRNPGVCSRCDGCKQIATSDDAEAWWTWMTLPKASQLAVTMGLVRPIDCPKCNGTGTA